MSKDVEITKKPKGVPLLSKAEQDIILAEAEKTGNFSATAKKYKTRVENLYRWKKARQRQLVRASDGTAAARPTSPGHPGEVARLRQEVEALKDALVRVTLEKEQLLRNR